MAIANFQALCIGLCEVAGVTPPALERDEHGALAFSICSEGVHVTVQQFNGCDGDVLLIAELGPVQEAGACRAWLSLLDANSDAPAESLRFARSPETGDALMLWALDIDALTLLEVQARLSYMVELTHHWLRQAVPGAHALPFHASAREVPFDASVDEQDFARRMEAFRALQAGLQGTSVSVSLSRRHPRHLMFTAPLPRWVDAANVTHLTALMDANLVPGLDRHGAVACREPSTQQFALMLAVPFDETTAGQCASYAARLANAAWECGTALAAAA